LEKLSAYQAIKELFQLKKFHTEEEKMAGKFKPAAWAVAAVSLMFVLVLTFIAAGCGETTETTTTAQTGTTPAGAGNLYVAVTGSAELEAGSGNMGMAMIDLETKKVEMVNLAEAKAPHGIIFSADTMTEPNTEGRVTTYAPVNMLMGNAQDGNVLNIDMYTLKVTASYPAPPGAKLAICGMYKGPDGKIYLASMADGNVYPFDPATKTIEDAMPNEAGTTSICGINWTEDGRFAYLVNMYNPANPQEPGYVAKIEWPSGKLVKKIENVTKPGGGPMAHQSAISPDGKYLYVTDGADNALVKIDVSTDTVAKSIPLGNGDVHSIVLSADGETGYLAVRHAPDQDQSSIYVMDMQKETVTETIPGIPAPLICGLVLQQP
jgi:YVTN family beta-propeller protein